MWLILGLIIILFILFSNYSRYDQRGFDKQGTHKNGTKYDDFGYDAAGYDREGYDQRGYDANGYNRMGYNPRGYNQEGKNAKGQYNRYFDTHYSKDGFCDPKRYPIVVTNHAKQRMLERMPVQNPADAVRLAYDAYCYGRSKRQIKKSSAVLIEEIESNHDGSILLIYRGYIYIFSEDNKLITVYKNDRIPL